MQFSYNQKREWRGAAQRSVAMGPRGMVASSQQLASIAGYNALSKGGNAVDAACAMLAATATMWDVLSWGGETQTLIYNPHTGKVVGINALGAAPTGATAEYYRELGHRYPPATGPLSAVTPGTPGGLMVMLAEYGSMSLAQVLAPAMEMAEGYPIVMPGYPDAAEEDLRELAQYILGS